MTLRGTLKAIGFPFLLALHLLMVSAALLLGLECCLLMHWRFVSHGGLLGEREEEIVEGLAGGEAMPFAGEAEFMEEQAVQGEVEEFADGEGV